MTAAKENIDTIQQQIISEFELLGEDWMEKYNYIIDFGKQLPKLAEQYKIEDNLVHGCQSQVWLHCYMNNEEVVYEADSDAIITKGLIGLLVRVLSNQQPKEVINTDLYFVDKIGMREHLSPTRSNGLSAMIKQMKLYAIGFQAKLEGGRN